MYEICLNGPLFLLYVLVTVFQERTKNLQTIHLYAHIHAHIYGFSFQEMVPETFSNLSDRCYGDFLKGEKGCHGGTKQNLYLACGGK